jgi:uncharacterized membrane protein
MSDETRILPAHIEETVRSIARLQTAHEEQASPLQRSTNRITASAGQPKFLVVVTIAMLVWVGANLALGLSSFSPFDPPPFMWLQGLLAVVALYMTILILATQRYADQLAGYREQLTLELAILTEQKTSKIIELLEELRRDDPLIHNRADPQADAMAAAADPEAVLDAIKEAQEELGAPTPK